MENSKVLVTGGAGFIGSHVADLLIESGYAVVVVDDLSAGRRENVNKRAKFYETDMRSQDLAEVFDAERPDFVVHLAAQVSVIHSIAEPMLDASLNVLGSLNVLENSVRTGVKKVVYVSTGGALYGEPQYLPCDEAHPIQPLSPYGVTKHTVEHYLYLYRHNRGLEHTTIRLPNVYGPRQDPFGEAGVIAIFSNLMLTGGQPIIFGDGDQERDFAYVRDCARGAVLALEEGKPEAYNIGTGQGTTVNRLFATMKALTGYPGEARYDPARPGEVYRIFLDASKARKELGWAPTVSLEDGLRETVDYFRSTLAGASANPRDEEPRR